MDQGEAITTLAKSRQRRSGGDLFDRLLLAMSHWQLGEKQTARHWCNEAVDAEKGGPGLTYEFTRPDLRRFQAEAEELMGLSKQSP